MSRHRDIVSVHINSLRQVGLKGSKRDEANIYVTAVSFSSGDDEGYTFSELSEVSQGALIVA